MRFSDSSRSIRLVLLTLGALASSSCGHDSPTEGQAGPPSAVQVARGDGQQATAGATLPDSLAVRVVDAQGRGVGGAAVVWASLGGTISPERVTTDAGGYARTSLRVGPTAGEVRVSARAAGLPAAGFILRARAGTASTVTRAGGDEQTGAPGRALPLPIAVRVRDANGNPVRGVTVTFAATSGGGTMLPTTATTDSLGVAGARWTLGASPGTQTATATASGLQPVAFTATAMTSTYTLELSPATQSVGYGGVVRLVATVRDDTGGVVTLTPPDTITWRSSDTAIVHVTGGGAAQQTGFAFGVRLGSARVSATWRAATAAADIQVTQPASGRFTAVSAGETHSCGIADDATAFCWGSNVEGQLGTGGADTAAPAAVTGGLTFGAITAGSRHTCAVSVTRQVYCWGSNFWGQLGDSLRAGERSGAPTRVASPLGFDSVSAGLTHTCALTSTGAAYCWGRNDYAQVSGAAPSENCHGVPCVSAPVPVAGGLSFRAISAGGWRHSCGLTTEGQVYCWGDNTFGQLGNGTRTSSGTPVAVAGGLSFVALAAGSIHTCALTAGGEAYCWGAGDHDQLGASAGDTCAAPWGGSVVCSTRPVSVAGGLSFRTVAAGRSVSCGVTTDGALYCWGAGVTGAAGTAGSTGASQLPARVATGVDRAFSSVEAGEQHTCGLLANAAAFCWGRGNEGQLGNGDVIVDITARINRRTPARVRDP